MLGRWTSMLLRGKQGVVTRFVSVYVPCCSKTHGNKTVFSQQQRALLKQKSTKGVIKSFWTDFWSTVDEWLAAGEQLIISGHWNQNIYSKSLVKEFEDRSMIPVITKTHEEVAPPTYNNGSYAIDEIFASSSLQIEACGYLEHGQNTGDHRPIWVEMTKQSVLGLKVPPVPSHKIRRLKCSDPNVVKKYNTILEQEFHKYDVYNRAMKLYSQFGDTLTPEQWAEYDDLDRIRSKAMKKAEKQCRKLHMGAIAWSPEMQYTRNAIQYIKLTIRKKKGRKVSARFLIRLSQQLRMNFVHMSINALEKEL